MDSEWQTEMSAWKDRNRYLLETGLRSDCCFLVGVTPGDQRRFNAHKFILSGGSEVFERMFYGSLPEGDEPIEVPDIEFRDFERLLQFIYTDEINNLETDESQRLYYAAMKYMLPKLKEACILCLKLQITSANVCEIFEFSKRYEEKELKDICAKIMRTETLDVLNSPSFLVLDLSTLECMLDENLLPIENELDLFTALENFANFRYKTVNGHDSKFICAICQQKQSDSKDAGENVKNEKIQDDHCQENRAPEEFFKLIRKLRFLTLTVEEFLKGPAGSKLISKGDALDILLCIENKRNVKDRFPSGFSKSMIPRRLLPSFT